MALSEPAPRRGPKRGDRRGTVPSPLTSGNPPPAYVAVLEEAQRLGLLRGEKSEHFSFHAPPALVEAAKHETGVTSTSALGLLALALLAQPDPVVAFMRRMRGRLGKNHDLEY
jgi:hypothetical protein